MTAPASAKFLSNACEDAAAARRIAEALRGFAIEVWFDQSELRGGGAWDSRCARGFEFGVLGLEFSIGTHP